MIAEKVDFVEKRIKRNLCPYLPDGYLSCYSRHCNTCEIADRIRALKARESLNYPLFTKENCLRQNVREGGSVFFRRLVLLSEEAMEKYCISKSLFYQVAFAYNGAGCLPQNSVGPVDIRLIADQAKELTVYRFELLGVPNEDALKRFDKIFFMGLHKRYK